MLHQRHDLSIDNWLFFEQLDQTNKKIIKSLRHSDIQKLTQVNNNNNNKH